MSLVDLGRILRARWLVVVLCVLAGLAAAATVTAAATPRYESSVSLYVSARAESGNAGSAYDASLVSAQRIASYAELATDPRVLDPVVARLRLPTDAASLADDVTATSEPDTVILGVTVQYPSPVVAAQIADAIAAELIGTVAQLEQAPAAQAPPPVGLALVRPATVPTVPVSPDVVVNLLLGFAVGLAVGIGAALARHALDTTVSTARGLREVVDAPVVGEIPRDDDPDVGVLTVRGRSNAPRPEAFRKLRTTLRFVSVDEPPVVVLVTSAVAGEGKSSTTANLAIAMAEVGEKVLVVEADLRLPQLAGYLGVVGEVGVTSVLSGDTGPADAVQRVERGRFDVLTSGPLPPNPTELLSSQAMLRLLVWARGTYDRVLIDTPPVLPVTDAAVLGHRADGALLVIRHGRTSVQDVESATEQLRAASTRLLGTVLVGTPPRASAYTPYHRPHGTGTTRAAPRSTVAVAAPRTSVEDDEIEPATDTILLSDLATGIGAGTTGTAGTGTTAESSRNGTVRTGPPSGRVAVRYTRLATPEPSTSPASAPTATDPSGTERAAGCTAECTDERGEAADDGPDTEPDTGLETGSDVGSTVDEDAEPPADDRPTDEADPEGDDDVAPHHGPVPTPRPRSGHEPATRTASTMSAPVS